VGGKKAPERTKPALHEHSLRREREKEGDGCRSSLLVQKEGRGERKERKSVICHANAMPRKRGGLSSLLLGGKNSRGSFLRKFLKRGWGGDFTSSGLTRICHMKEGRGKPYWNWKANSEKTRRSPLNDEKERKELAHAENPMDIVADGKRNAEPILVREKR